MSIFTPYHRNTHILPSLLTWTGSRAQAQINQCPSVSCWLAGSISLECEFIGLTLPTGHYFIWESTTGNSFQGWHHARHPRFSRDDSSVPWSIVPVTKHRKSTLKCHSSCLTAFQINQVPFPQAWCEQSDRQREGKVETESTSGATGYTPPV